MAKRLNREKLLERLERITYERKNEPLLDRFEQIGLAGGLLQIAELTHEQEYELCRRAAQHALGRIPEPDDTDPES